MIVLKLFLGLFVAWLLGYLIVYLFDQEKKLSMVEGAALSYLIGQGSITLLLFLLFLMPIDHQRTTAVFLIAALFVLKFIFDKKKHWFNPAGFISKLRRLFKNNKKNLLLILMLMVLLFSFAVKISYPLIDACSKPEYGWDASGNWTLIGKDCFYAEKYQPDKVLGQLKKHVSGYPRGLSLMHYWLFSWMGEANDQWSKIIFPIELLCLLIIFYYGLKPIRGKLGALIFTYFLCSAPLFLYHATIGYADLTKTTYFAVGIIYFYRWIQTKQNHYFWFFSLALSLTTWIKFEGKTLYAIGLALLLFYLWRSCIKGKLFYLVRYLFLYMIIGLPWELFIIFNGLQNLQSKMAFSFYEFFAFHKIMYTLMFMEGSWGLFWFVFVAACLFFFKRQFKGNNLYLLGAILLFYGNLIFIYLCYHNAVGAMVLTFNRVLLPLYPVVVFNLGCIIPVLTVKKEFEI